MQRWSGEIWLVWSGLAVRGRLGTSPSLYLCPHAVPCCFGRASLGTCDVGQSDIIAANRDVAYHSVQRAYIMVCVHACHAVSCYLRYCCQNRPQLSNAWSNSLSVVLVVFACLASSGWHGPLARQVLPSMLMVTSETVHFKESVLQRVQQRRPCSQHCPRAKSVQTDPSTDVHARQFHGHQA